MKVTDIIASRSDDDAPYYTFEVGHAVLEGCESQASDSPAIALTAAAAAETFHRSFRPRRLKEPQISLLDWTE